MKKILSVFLAALVIFSAFALCSCNAPKAGEIRDRLEELIDASYEINEIFFGSGLKTYPRITPLTDRPFVYSEEKDVYYLFFTDEEGRELCMYYDNGTKDYRFALKKQKSLVTESDGTPLYTDEKSQNVYFAAEYAPPEIEYVYSEEEDKHYDVVRFDEKYITVDEIKKAAEKVYTKEYLSQIYQGAFDGIAFVEGSTSGVRSARFIEDDLLLRQRNDTESKIAGRRIYDFSTLKVIFPSGSKRVNIKIKSHIEGQDKITEVRLTLKKGSDGQWYLDTPTY